MQITYNHDILIDKIHVKHNFCKIWDKSETLENAVFDSKKRDDSPH